MIEQTLGTETARITLAIATIIDACCLPSRFVVGGSLETLPALPAVELGWWFFFRNCHFRVHQLDSHDHCEVEKDWCCKGNETIKTSLGLGPSTEFQ